MIFKQNVLKEEKIKFIILITCIAVPYVAIAIINFINQYEIKFFITLLIIFFLPILLLIIFIGINNLEWYYIYNDCIESRNLYGIKNTVFFENVSFVEEIKLNLTTRGMEKEFYIFNDGRMNNNNIFDSNSCYNNKKFNFRIYKTEELEKYIINILKIKVNKDDS